METTFQDQLTSVIRQIKIQENGLGELALDIAETPYSATNQTLPNVLMHGIYRHFYIEQEDVQIQEELFDKKDDGQQATADFQKRLAAANSNIEHFDKGWVVETTDLRGTLYASKGNFRRQVYAGEFLYSNYKKGNAYQGDRIELLARKDYDDQQGAFYYVFGRTLGNENHSQQVRIYFHLQPEGSIELIKALSILDKYAIPFTFKCLNNPALYVRADSAVLYLDKQFANFFFRLMPDIDAKINHCLLPKIPRFTRLLKRGIAFAESPPNPTESFGTSRSQLIAQGIVTAFQQKQPIENWEQAVLSNFKRINISENAPYLNPGSQYPYQFPTL